MIHSLDELLTSTLDAMVGHENVRHEVVRSGPREPIPRWVRSLIYRRDGYSCQLCGDRLFGKRMELDHVLPWSAGGPDLAYNLRTACQPCNQGRSNYRDDRRTYMPVINECLNCQRERYRRPGVGTTIAFCGGCKDLGPAFVDEVR